MDDSPLATQDDWSYYFPMPRTADPTDIPNRLLQAGHLLFQQQGYNATGVSELATQAGVPKGSFYNHFDSKEAFAIEIIRRYAQSMDATWDGAMATLPPSAEHSPREAIRHLFNTFIAHHEQATCPGCLVGNFSAELAESSPACREALDTAMRHWHQRLTALIEQAQQAGEVRRDVQGKALSAFFWNAWQGALLRMKVTHDAKPLRECLRLMLDHFFQGPALPDSPAST